MKTVMKSAKARSLRQTTVASAMALTVSTALSVTADLSAAEVLGARAARHDGHTRLVIDLSQRTTYTIRSEDGQVKVALADDVVVPQKLKTTISAGIVTNVRAEDGSTLALDLMAPATVMRSYILPASQAGHAPHRLVVDLAAAPQPLQFAAVAQANDATMLNTMSDTTVQYSDDTAGGGDWGDSSGSVFDGFNIDGYAEIEGRIFSQGSQEPVPPSRPKRQTLSFAIEPSFSYTWDDGRSLLAFTPFMRFDSNDDDRTHFDVRELKWVGAFDALEVRVGVDKLFWGVTESQHIVDIINQDDGLEDVDGEDKLGQPLVGLSYETGVGTFSVYAMTYFRERRFAGPKGRPRGPLPIDYRQTQYEAGSDKWHVDLAARWSHIFGPIDIAVSHFRGTSRDPVLIQGLNAVGDPVLIPRYNLIDQTGIELQGTFGPVLLKAEGIRKAQPGENQYAGIAGFEYTIYGLGGGSSDLGILAEYLWDNRTKPIDNPFEDDLFVALRWTANDVSDTTLLGGAILDLDTKQKFILIEASRRLGDHWKLSVDTRLFVSVPTNDPLFFYRDDDFVQIKLQRFF